MIAGTWKERKCPSADEWINKMGHLDTVIQSEVSEKEKQTPYVSTHTYIYMTSTTVEQMNIHAKQK